MSEGDKRPKGWLRKVIVAVLIVALVVSGASLVKDYMDKKRSMEEYRRLAEMAKTTTEAVETSEEVAQTSAEETEAEEEAPYESPIDFEALRKVNPDIVGWLTIPGTNIDYPVVQGTDNDKYLHTSFEGETSVAGAIYLDFESDADMQGKNNIIYGHNMKNGTMFKDINQYKDESFFKEHQEFFLYTPERTIRLKAVAAYYGEAKPIVRKTKFKSQESFDAFVQEMISPCTYAEMPEGQLSSLYTLVTCSYEINDARTFLFAVDMDEPEGKADDSE